MGTELLLKCGHKPRPKLILTDVGHIKFTEHWVADHYRGRFFKELECSGKSVSAKHMKLSDEECTISKINN